MPRLAVLALVPLAACGFGHPFGEDGVVGSDFCDESVADAVDDDWAEDLDAVGCGWRLRAVDPHRWLLLTFDVPAFVAALDGEAASVSYVLPDDAVRLTLDAGCRLEDELCGGADQGTPTVMYTWEPTEGVADVSLTEDATATVVFTGVTLENAEGSTTTLDGTFTVTLEATPE